MPIFGLWLPSVACGEMGISLWTFYRQTLPNAALVALIVGVITWSVTEFWPPTTLGILVLELALAGAVFGVLSFAFGLDDKTRGMILKRVKELF
jgi:hypothetical protein